MSLQSSALQNTFGLRCDGKKQSADVETLLFTPRGVTGGLVAMGGWAVARRGLVVCFGLGEAFSSREVLGRQQDPR